MGSFFSQSLDFLPSSLELIHVNNIPNPNYLNNLPSNLKKLYIGSKYPKLNSNELMKINYLPNNIEELKISFANITLCNIPKKLKKLSIDCFSIKIIKLLTNSFVEKLKIDLIDDESMSIIDSIQEINLPLSIKTIHIYTNPDIHKVIDLKILNKIKGIDLDDYDISNRYLFQFIIEKKGIEI